jgi:ATP-binding protein involved in chromosome partitioning
VVNLDPAEWTLTQTRQALLNALRGVTYPGFDRDIVTLGVVRNLEISEGRATVEIHLSEPDSAAAETIRKQVTQVLGGLAGVTDVAIRMAGVAGGSDALKVLGKKPSVAASGSADPGLLPGVKHTIAVASGKGGVGKSTVAVNLALSLARQGLTTGLLDADIYGPSVPIMMGATGKQPELDSQRQLLPFEGYGVRYMSLGFLVAPDSAVIWRGPMVMKAIEQLLRDVRWGDLDVLVLDMPPGTGDAQLTLSQKVRLAGAVIVTTPQDVALADAVKGVAMFRKVDVPILGIVENMSYFECPSCNHRSEIFSHGGGRREAERLGVPFLGEIPLDPAVRGSGDSGHPVVDAQPDSAPARAFAELADGIRTVLQGATPDPSGGGIFDRFRKVWPASRD